jgi:hypothetical protein
MRTIKNQNIPQNSDAKFPFSTILNETETNSGTPVIEEVYGDILTNIYKLLQVVGVTASETQDSDTSQYQILEALKLLPNSLNDIEQVLSLTATTWSVSLDLDFLPNKYFFIARANDDYVSGTSYNFKGTTDTTYPFNSLGFKSGDELLVIIDQGTVRGYSLTFFRGVSNEIFPIMGTPLSFNDSVKLWYQDEGKLISDAPSSNNLQNVVRAEMDEPTILVLDIFVMNDHALCYCFNPVVEEYFFRQFELSDLTVSEAVTLSGSSFTTGVTNAPYVYIESGFVYITNYMNASSLDYSFSKLAYSSATATLTYDSYFNIDNTFVKTSNAFIKSGALYTMVLGVLESYNLSTGIKTVLGTYSSVLGQVFSFGGQIYYSTGEVAKKWF